jgi:hypothetical protein
MPTRPSKPLQSKSPTKQQANNTAIGSFHSAAGRREVARAFVRVRPWMAMKTAMSANAMHFKEFLIAMSARVLAIGYTPTSNHDNDFLGVEEYVLRTA